MYFVLPYRVYIEFKITCTPSIPVEMMVYVLMVLLVFLKFLGWGGGILHCQPFPMLVVVLSIAVNH